MLSLTRRTIEIAAFLAALLIAAMALHAWLASRDDQARLASTLSAQKQLLDAANSREAARQSALTDTLSQIEALKRTTLTPDQILRALPQYLNLPQPITLVDPAASASASAADKSGKGTDEPARSVSPSRRHEPGTMSEISAANNQKAAEEPQQSVEGIQELIEEVSKSGSGKQLSRGTPPGAPGTARLNTSQATGANGRANAPAASAPQTPGDAGAGASTSASDTPDLPAAPAAQIPAADLKPFYDYVQDCRECDAKLAAAAQDKLDDAAKIAALERERDAAITASKGGTFWQRFRRNALWFAAGCAAGASATYAASHHPHASRP